MLHTWLLFCTLKCIGKSACIIKIFCYIHFALHSNTVWFFLFPKQYADIYSAIILCYRLKPTLHYILLIQLDKQMKKKNTDTGPTTINIHILFYYIKFFILFFIFCVRRVNTYKKQWVSLLIEIMIFFMEYFLHHSW